VISKKGANSVVGTIEEKVAIMELGRLDLE